MDDNIELFNEACLETLIKRPREFFKKIHLWRVSEFDTPTIKPYSFNVGTRLSNGRFSSFWVSSEKDWAIFYGLRVLLTGIAMKKMNVTSDDVANNTNNCRKRMVREYRFDYSNLFFINSSKITEEEVKDRCNSHPIFLYGKKVRGYETGLGWHNPEEYTLDKEVEFDSKEKIVYDDFKKFIKYMTPEEYSEKYEERLSKKDPSGKKYDEDLGFPYFNNPREVGEERVVKYFNKMIKSALHEKDKSIRDNLIKELAAQYKLMNGYAFRLMKLDKDTINIPNEYINLFESEEVINMGNEDLSYLFSESTHWDTVLTKPFSLNKKIKLYHISDVKDPNGFVYPLRKTVGNRLSKDYYCSWWSEYPNYGLLVMWFCKDSKYYNKNPRLNLPDCKDNWCCSTDDKEPIQYIRKSYYDLHKSDYNKFVCYEYSHTFKIGELGRGQEYALTEWTYDKEVKCDNVKKISFDDCIRSGQVVLLNDDEFSIRKAKYDEAKSKGHNSISDFKKKPWIYYKYDKVIELRDKLMNTPGYLNPEYFDDSGNFIKENINNLEFSSKSDNILESFDINSNSQLTRYLKTKILPKYNNNIIDMAHRENHILSVLEKSMNIANDLRLTEREKEIVFTVAMMHDIGLLKGDREKHNILSAEFIRSDKFLNDYFSNEEINTIAEAVEDHRASLKYEPRSIYGKIVSTADRDLDIESIVRRIIQYRLGKGMTNYDDIYNDSFKHFKEKFSRNGYMQIPLKTRSVKEMLEKIYKYDDEKLFKVVFDKEFNKINSDLNESYETLFETAIQEGLLKRNKLSNQMKKEHGTRKYGDAFDKVYKRLRDKGYSHNAAIKEAGRKMRKYDEISYPIIPKIKKHTLSYDDYMDAYNISQNDPHDGTSITIKTKEGKNIKFSHGAGKNDPKTPKVSGKGVHQVVACNSRGNGAGRKNVGKGTYPTHIYGTVNNDGDVTTFVGSGSKAAFEKRKQKENDKNKKLRLTNANLGESYETLFEAAINENNKIKN